MHEAMWLNIDYFLAVLHGFWDLSSPVRDQTRILWVKIENLNHWTTRELPQMVKYFECHSGPLTSQKQPPSRSYSALAVHRPGMCRDHQARSRAPVSALASASFTHP